MLLVGLLAACGPAVGGPATAPAAAAATRAPSGPPATGSLTVPEALLGNWTADIENTTVTPGVWTLHITAYDLTLENPHSSDAFSIDPTGVTATTLSLAPSSDADCPEQSARTPGTYGISLQGDSLRFTLTSDSCGGRSAVLTGGTWTRKP